MGGDPAEASQEGCTFCGIIGGEEKSFVVLEDAVSLAFLDRVPLFPGHCLLVPKEHYETLLDLPDELVAPLFLNAKLLARALELGVKAQGSFVAVNNRISQSVPHLHVHAVPRHSKDGLKGFFWPRHKYRDEAHMREVQEALRSAIERLRRG